MNIPDNLKYTKDHEWVLISDDEAVVGITEFAQSELGEIVFVELPAPGDTIEKNSTLCVVESTKAASDVYAPLTGVIQEVNAILGDTPDLVNTEPYAGGWLVKITGVNSSEFSELLSAEEYRSLTQE